MKKRYRSLVLIALAVLGGCSPGYNHWSLSGQGYSEIMVSQDSFVVSYKGNAFTPPQDVLRYSLLRAAELTLRAGYKYFVVLSSVDQTTSSNYLNALTQSGTFTVNSGTMVHPGASIKIRCLNDKPTDAEYFDAQFYWNMNKDE